VLRSLVRFAVIALLLSIGLCFGRAQDKPLKLNTGDVLLVTVSNVNGFNGEYTVLSDGSISGVGISRLSVAGKTLSQAKDAIIQTLSKRIKNPHVDLVLKSESAKSIFFVGSIDSTGVTPWRPGANLQNALSQVKIQGDPDLVEVTLYRKGESPRRFGYQAVVRGELPSTPLELEPGDVISLLPAREIRVWVLGKVEKAGEVKVREGSGLYEALAEAGGLEKGTILPSDMKLVLRRGDQSRTYPAEARSGDPKVVLEPGDTLFVEAPTLIRVTVAGEVTQPGEVTVRDGASIVAGISAARGKTAEGSLENVMLFRKGQVQVLNATALIGGQPDQGVTLQNEDLLVVQRSAKRIHVLGNVTRPSEVLIPDNQVYRVSDALAQAGGISGQGTLRRVTLIRPNKDGKLAIKAVINLDEFLKDGKQEANPVVEPGDVLYFGQPKGVTGQTVLQAVSGALLIQSVFRF